MSWSHLLWAGLGVLAGALGRHIAHRTPWRFDITIKDDRSRHTTDRDSTD